MHKPNFFTKDLLSSHKHTKRFMIGDYSYGKPEVLTFNDNTSLVIGKFCSIAKDVTIILGGNHRADWVTTYPFSAIPEVFPEALHINGHPSTKGDVIIGNDVWIGYGSTIMSGITIGDGAIIGARSVVAKDIPPYSIAVGNPSRVVRYRFEREYIEHLLTVQWWNWDIEKIRENIRMLLSPEIMKLGI